MLIRRLVIASLVAGAASAQAGNIAQPSNVVGAWTTGNGTDVVASGVLQGNLSLVAGVAHGADAKLTDVLYGKVAGSAQQVDGQTKLVYQSGIEANYLLAAGNGIVAATAGLGKSVVGSVDGVIISDGMAKAPGLTGGGNQTSNNGIGGGAGNTGNTGNTGSTGGGATTTPEAGQGNKPTDTSGQIPGKGDGVGAGIGNGEGIGNGGLNGNGNGIGTGNGDGLGNIGNAEGEGAAAEVPEPSSIALMLLGMVGAGALSRRRSR